MLDGDPIRFTIPEILSLIGLAQGLYILVYMAFRAGDMRRAALPFLYFLVLATAFFLDFAESFIGASIEAYYQWQWAAWFLGPPASVLLILQISQIRKLPSLSNLWVLALVPLAWLAGRFLAGLDDRCILPGDCPILKEWLVICGLIAGALSLLTIWAHRGLLEGLSKDRSARDRYWLVITLIFVNAAFLIVMLFSLTPTLTTSEVGLIRTVLGLGFVYIAGTSLFRIYPQAVTTVDRKGENGLSPDEKEIARKIGYLLEREKVYQEASYSRADLAREVDVSESVVSRVINDFYQKSLPQLLNDYRIEEAKQLLVETDAPVKMIGEEVGFNSASSFNRVFRDTTGITPTAYRVAKAKASSEA